MASTTATFAGAFTPADHGDLLIATASKESVAMQTTRVVSTDATEYRIPIISGEVDTGWYGELQEIDQDDVTTDEEIVRPSKVAALSKISRELADDSNPSAANAIGASIGRSIANSIDAAFYGDADGTGDVPKGLGSFTDAQLTTVDAGEAWTNADPFVDAVYQVEAAGGSVSAFVANPADARVLAKLKRDADSNEPLLAASAGDATRRSLSGVPLYVSRHVPEGTIYGYDRNRLHTVVRTGTEMMVDASVFFAEFAVAIRGVARVGFAYGHPATIARIKLSDGA